MGRKLRKCIVCGKEYEYCNSCKGHASHPSWKAIYHDENCRSVMNITTEYAAGNITKSEAKRKLDACDLTNKKTFKDSVLKVVNDIYYIKKPEKVKVVTPIATDEEATTEIVDIDVE